MLVLKGIEKTYGGKLVLDDVNLSIPKGSCYGLVGPNGAGKSTCMKIIASIIDPSKGTIQLKENNRMRNQIGYVPQEICLELQVTARQNLSFFGKLYGLKGKELQDRATKVLEEIGLIEHENEKVHTFSGGMKRRLNIGCALMHEPSLILMDEPTVGIDPQSRRYIFQMIERLKKNGSTIIYASHYMEEVERLCDAIAFIDHGKVIADGKITEMIAANGLPAVYVQGKIEGPIEVGEIATMEKDNGGYMYRTEYPLQVMEQITKYCIGNKVQLEKLELVNPSLEDVFFQLTGSQLRE